jgi:hypothetical protein
MECKPTQRDKLFRGLKLLSELQQLDILRPSDVVTITAIQGRVAEAFHSENGRNGSFAGVHAGACTRTSRVLRQSVFSVSDFSARAMSPA